MPSKLARSPDEQGARRRGRTPRHPQEGDVGALQVLFGVGERHAEERGKAAVDPRRAHLYERFEGWSMGRLIFYVEIAPISALPFTSNHMILHIDLLVSLLDGGSLGKDPHPGQRALNKLKHKATLLVARLVLHGPPRNLASISCRRSCR